ncbi:DNA-directed RNA polymerase subunit H [Candidatus Pacearchaeota archaeon]|nr:MAG: DNA-directed RNA polymerase subunit H [Candidatus Pacearchaeota archaeon]
MHVLQPKHEKLSPEETEKLLEKLNISLSQLPKISIDDPAVPKGCKKGDVLRIERKGSFPETYFRVVV